MKKLQKDGAPKLDESHKGKPAQKKRFLIMKLEERIAPQCHYNPQGKLVGRCKYCI